MNLDSNMDHEESLANINTIVDNHVLVEQTQEMKENTATTPHPVADKQRKKSSDNVVIETDSDTELSVDYTYMEHLASSLQREMKDYLMWCSNSLEIPEGVVKDIWDERTSGLLDLSAAILTHTRDFSCLFM